MGSLRNYSLKRVGCDVFFETGTGSGASLKHALDSRQFEKLYSAEIHRETALSAKRRFGDNPNVTILNSDSIGALSEVLPSIAANARVLFFLDAHFPGEVAKDFEGYSSTVPGSQSLPLEDELRLIKALRPLSDDLIIVDDLRIYEDGPFENGNLPANFANIPDASRHLKFVGEIFGDRSIERDYREEGYILITPRASGFRLERLSLASRITRRVKTTWAAPG